MIRLLDRQIVALFQSPLLFVEAVEGLIDYVARIAAALSCDTTLRIAGGGMTADLRLPLGGPLPRVGRSAKGRRGSRCRRLAGV